MDPCIFCKIINGEIASKIFYQDEDFIVIHDISPKAPVHVLLMSVKHIESLQNVTEEDSEFLGKMMITVNKIARKLGIAESGYKVVINNGKGSGQMVFHLHLHILGGWKKLENWKV